MNEETALKWYKQACHDLEMAEKNIEIEGYDVTAFLLQHAEEECEEEDEEHKAEE
jgi:HEPN domain-containing protein